MMEYFPFTLLAELELLHWAEIAVFASILLFVFFLASLLNLFSKES